LKTWKFHEIWVEQCAAAERIKRRYGLKAAFDYLVGEKLLNFTEAAVQHPEFARELPRFVARVRRMFTPVEMLTHFARVEDEQSEYNADIEEDEALDNEDQLIFESPAAAAQRARQFGTIKDLLTAAELGTS
jgi:hypothetical protein